MNSRLTRLALAAAAALAGISCNQSTSSDPDRDWKCAIASGAAPDSSLTLGCVDDFTTLSSQPLDASLPGALSLKTVIDRDEKDKLYFQNSKKFKIHYEFAKKHLSVESGKALVPSVSVFSQTEYYTRDRRFILGALTRYEGPKVWTYEISPDDNASADMIALAYGKVKESCFCGDSLFFHPTSQAVEAEAKKLPSTVKIITTDELYRGIDYQPLNFATGMGRLVFMTAKELETAYLDFRDIVVLDEVPNDISVTSGIITQQFQTPLSHINVLSQNRGTPNMGLRGAYTDSALRALEGKWVKLVVGAFSYAVDEVTKGEADAWWDDHKPDAVGVPNMDTTVKELRDVKDILDLSNGTPLKEAIKKAIPAFGGKTSHFAGFPHMDSTKVTSQYAFGIPVYYYWQHMEKHGLNDTVDAMLADPKFQSDPAERDRRLKALRNLIETSPIDSAFWAALNAKIAGKLPGLPIRFRSSTNAEDLDGFTGAGLYDSKTGNPNDPSDPISKALLKVWASVWYFRAFEERSYRSIDHKAVGMSILVHKAHPEEEANGVAITANPFDPSGLEPGFYINVQAGTESVVQPDPSITTDQFIYHFDMPGQPIVFLANSNLIPKGTTVLTVEQTNALGIALKEIHRFFKAAYGTDPTKWYAMDTEFKLDQLAGDPKGKPVIIMKQARPYPGWGQQ